MSTEKLIELSKPVAYTDADELRFHHATSDMWPVPLGFGKDVSLYSQEYVSALLAERDAFEASALALRDEWRARGECIAELERANTSQEDHINQQQDRIDSLEKKNGDLGRSLGAAEKRLATPVRLPDIRFIKVGETAVAVMHAERVKERLKAAGFTVERDE